MFGACRSAHMLKAMVKSDAAAAIIFAAMQRLLEIDSEGCHQAFMFARDKSLIRTGDGHGDRWDRQLLALWIRVHQCDQVVIAPDRSEYVGSREVRHLWSCENCGHQIEMMVDLRISAKTKPTTSLGVRPIGLVHNQYLLHVV